MRLIKFFFLLLCLVVGICSEAQTSDSWFTIKRIDSGTWVINEHNIVNIYLLEGKDKALLIDTGIGIADLFSLVKSITNKPLFVVNTHGHIDHAGANYQFEKIYVHPNDRESINKFNTPPEKDEMLSLFEDQKYPSGSDLYAGTSKISKIELIHEGYIFDLGGRQVEVIETPGHTRGSVCLLDINNRILYTGDTNNKVVWLFLDECLPLSDYLKSLNKEVSRIDEFDTLMPGHGPYVGSKFIKDQVECVKNILKGTCATDILETFLGDKIVCKYGAAEVAFNPNNL